MLPHIAGRPVMLLRCPQGREEKCFHQKHPGDSAPAHVRSIPIREKEGKEAYLVVDNQTGLLELVNLGALEFHTWGASETNIEKPDLMVFDLDPDPGVTRKALVEGVLLVKQRLEDLGLKTFLKTTGGKGFHVVVPLQRRQGWDEVKAFSKAIAESIAAEDPAHYIANMSLAKRKGKIFIDYLRNGRGATFIAPFSTRARKSAPVATPLDWHEFGEEIEPAGWTVKDLKALLARGEIWEEMNRTRQSITAKMMKSVGIDAK
jgi:bifunctional non-homologous end joining protein LigD